MSRPNQQIPLDLPYRTALGRDNFLVGAANQDAVAWIDRWPRWDRPALILHGEAASGKSHLAAAWAEKSGARIIPASDLSTKSAAELATYTDHCVIDGLDIWVGDKDSETTLFHLYNMFLESARSMILTMRSPPSTLDFALPDLASRLRSLPVATIAPPDDDLLSAILIKLFYDRQITVSVDVIKYIVPRMERSFSAAQTIVEHADHIALSRQSAVTVPVLRTVLNDL